MSVLPIGPRVLSSKGLGISSAFGANAMKRLSIAALGFIGTFVTQSAMAAPLTETTVGLKLLAGAEIWSAPSDVPSGQQGIGFTGSAGGIGYGAMGYYDLRIIKLIGLEVDLAYQHG